MDNVLNNMQMQVGIRDTPPKVSKHVKQTVHLLHPVSAVMRVKVIVIANRVKFVIVGETLV